MPRAHVYLSDYHAARRNELPPDVTLSGLLAEALDSYFSAQKVPTSKRTKQPA